MLPYDPPHRILHAAVLINLSTHLGLNKPIPNQHNVAYHQVATNPRALPVSTTIMPP